MLNKKSPIALFFTIALLTPVLSQACEVSSHNIYELEKNSLSDLSKNNKPEKLYNFRTGNCSTLPENITELDAIAFIPEDETSLGIFQLYLQQGEKAIDAIKHTLEFDVKEQHS